MANYVYPAIFTREENGQFSVSFPDIEGCYSGGDDLAEALELAEDALALMLYHYEKEAKEIPAPSSIEALDPGKDGFVNYVACNTLEYQRRKNNKAVKKTLTIPEWLNEAATSAGVNFSQLLQEAIINRLHLA